MEPIPVLPCDAAPAFARSPQDVPPILPNATHLMHEIPSIFSPAPDPSTGLTTIVPVPVADVLASPLVPTPGFMPEFQSPCDSFGISTTLDSDMAMNSSHIHHPPVSDPPVTSPSLHTITSEYTIGTSSLATALDNMNVTMSRPRAGSTTSPGKSLGNMSTNGFSMNGTLPTPVEPAGVPFPPANFTGSINDRTENVPEVHGVNVGHALQSIAGYTADLSGTAQSASDAWFIGQNAEVDAIFHEVKQRWSVITELITKIDASLSLKEASPPPHPASATLPVTAQGTPLIGMFPPVIDGHPMDVNPDVSDSSRKRCASSMASSSGPADRVIKAAKIEPVDDSVIPLATSPTKVIPLSPPHLFTPAAISANAVANPSLSPSEPPSRPLTPGTMNVTLLQQSSPVVSPSASSLEYAVPATMPLQSAPATSFPIGPRNRSSWSDSGASLPHRHHQHSLSGTALNTAVNVHGLSMMPSTSTQPFPGQGTFGTPSVPPVSIQRPAPNSANPISPPLGRITRSGSITAPAINPRSFGFSELPNVDNSYDYMPSRTAIPPVAPQRVSPESDEGEEELEDEGVDFKNSLNNHSSPESSSVSGHSNEIPQEYKAEVDRIFFEFLNKICSNLDASDSKGEPIHQTLMAKKMQRLDESPDFRPFKFRIAAFTNAFLDELARQGYPEEKIPMKKVRNYLWRQEYIQRYNEDGKKAKSKGNHIWNIDAKKGRDGGWVFRPFRRRLAGSPPGIAYIGLKWSWTPRIWDPQASASHLPVRYSSPVLPSWLSWTDDVLSGTPPPDAESCDITAEARVMRDGQEDLLSLTFHLNIAPISTLDTSYSPSRRPSLASVQTPRRVQSDSTIPQIATRSIRPLNPLSQAPPAAPSQGAQVIQVLTSAAQRVAQEAHEAQSQVATSWNVNEPSAHELQALAKQQHVFRMTAAAVGGELNGPRQEGTAQSPRSVLAAAAQAVVLQAARSVRADRTAVAAAAAGVPVPTNTQQLITVNEVSVATQTAVAQAVELTGPLSSEVDVLRTATSLLQHTLVPIPQPEGPSVIPPVESIPTSAPLPPRILPLPNIAASVFPPHPEFVPPS